MILRATRTAAAVCLVVSLFSSLHACATRYLPPPAMPSREVPTVAAEVPAAGPGEGTVTLDVVGGPARVEEVTGRTAITAGMETSYTLRPRGMLATGALELATRPLCITPCTVNLSYGLHEMAFTSADPAGSRSSTAFINVGRAPSVVRHAMGFQESHIGGILGTILLGALGGSAVLSGSALVAFGHASDAQGTDLATAGWITLGVGAALATAAVILGVSSRPESQPGATLQWTPSAAP